MAANPRLLCIHRDPTQLNLLQNSGYDVLTATNGHEGLRLFMTRRVDAIVLEYYLGLLDGGTVASEIKKIQPHIPILMVVDHLEVPDGALGSVDMVVAKFDGDQFLLSALRSVLTDEPILQGKERRACRTSISAVADQAAGRTVPEPLVPNANVPFSPEECQGILTGDVKFGSDIT